MTQIGEAFVRVRPDTTSFGRELDRQVTPAVRRVEGSLRSTNREFARFGRGALVGTGALGGLGRAAAFASTTFIGGAGLVYALRSTIKAAEEAQVSETQLQNALTQQGISFERNKDAIDRRVQAMSQLAGIDDELVRDTFVKLVRRTEDITKALRLEEIAVNVARGRHISLEASSQLVIKASLGMAGQLRRLGIAAKEGATATQLLDLIQRKYAGSAAAYGRTAAGAQERFKVALENTQETIGTALLPTLTRYLNKLTAWLNDTDNQKRIQEIANKTVERGSHAVATLAHVYDSLATPVKRAGDLIRALSGGDEDQGMNKLTAAIERQAAALKKLADGYRGVEEARRGATEATTGLAPGPNPPNIPARVRGQAFIGGVPVSAAQELQVRLSQFQGTGTAAETAVLEEIIAADERALAFAKSRIGKRGTNTKNLVDAIVKLNTEIGADEERLAQITAENAAKVEEAADKAKVARQAQIAALIATAETGVNRSGLTKTLQDDLTAKENLVSVLTGLVAADRKNLELQNQLIAARSAVGETRDAIAAASRAATEALSTALQERFAALKLGREGGLLGGLTSSGLTREQEIRFQIAEAGAKTEEALRKVYARELDALKQGLQIIRLARGTQEQILDSRLAIVQKQKQIDDLEKKRDGGFTLTEFFTEASRQRELYGSDIGPAGFPLSGQDARADVAGHVRLPLLQGATIVQNFFGERNPGQAIQQASQAARALK